MAKRRGFTFIELLVVIAIFTILVGLGMFMSMETFRGTTYRSEQATIVSLLERARSRAMNNINQSQWGVCYLAPQYVIFRGSASSCATATVADTVAAHAGIAAASDFAHVFPIVVFTQLSGTTTATTITELQDGRSSVIAINNEGTINW